MSSYKGYKVRISNDELSYQEQVKRDFSGSLDEVERIENPREAQAGAGKAVIAHLGKQAAQYAIGNYGNLTGDYITQAKLSGVVELAGMAALAFSSPVGAVAAVGSLAIQTANHFIDIEKSRQESDFLRIRTGMILESRSR